MSWFILFAKASYVVILKPISIYTAMVKDSIVNGTLRKIHDAQSLGGALETLDKLLLRHVVLVRNSNHVTVLKMRKLK